MKRDYPPLPELKSEFGRHKEIPAAYEEVILKTLSHFPELKDTRIEFRLTDEHTKTHSTDAPVLSLIAGVPWRTYTVTLLEKAPPPMESALLKNLPFEAQIAAIAHELAHIVQHEKGGAPAALKIPIHRKDKKRAREREADISVIEHGLGFELYTYATFVRTLRDYVEEKDIDVNHLHPNEILAALPPEQLHKVHR